MLCYISSQFFQKEWKVYGSIIFLLFSLFLVCVFCSAWFSNAPYLSWVGSSKQESLSFLSFVAYGLLFFLVIEVINTQTRKQILIFSLLLSSVISGLLGCFALLGLPIFSFFGAQIYSTIGSINNFCLFSLVTSLLFIGFFIFHTQEFPFFFSGWRSVLEKGLCVLLSVQTVFILLLVDYKVFWILFIIGCFLFLGSVFLKAQRIAFWKLCLPIIITFISLLFLFVPRPFSREIPVEVTPGNLLSWHIATQTLQTEGYWFGSGPGTYSFDFAKHHSADLNQTIFWNTRFADSYSFFLTMIPTMGIVTTSIFVLFFLIFFFFSLKTILQKSNEKNYYSQPFFCAWLILVVSLFLFSMNITLFFLLFGLSGILAQSFLKEKVPRILEKKKIRILFSGLLLFAFSIVLVFGVFFSIQRFVAEAAYAKAVQIDRQQASTSDLVSWLETAAHLNRFHDGYYRNLATALYTLSVEKVDELEQKESISDSEKSYVQALIAASINAIVRATDLSPSNGLNWIERQKIYRGLLAFHLQTANVAVSSGLQAITLEPINPVAWTEFGKTYLAIVTQDVSLSSDNQQEYLKQAESAFGTSIDLKSDYSVAHYQLALTYELQGRLNDAIQKMEQVIIYNPSDVGAFFQLGVYYLKRLEEGDLDRAGEAFADAITLLPSYTNAHWYLASVYEQKQLEEYAIMEVQKVLELDPGNQLAEARLRRLQLGQLEQTLPEALE